jgi:hypothetical protein
MNERARVRAAMELAKAALEKAGGQPPCSNAPDLWFEVADPNEYEDGREARQDDFKWAKKMCLTCDILLECRQYGLEYAEEYGVWGGLSPLDRRRMLAKGEK